MPKFKVGDKVKILQDRLWATSVQVGDILTIKEVCGDGTLVTVERSWRFNGDALNYLELISPKQQPLTNTIITNITSPEQHKRVQEKLFEMGNKNIGNRDCNYCEGIKVYETGLIDSLVSYTGVNYDEVDWKHIPASEFLGEEETLEELVEKSKRYEIELKEKIFPETDANPMFVNVGGEIYGLEKLEGNNLTIKINTNNNSKTEPCVGGKNKIMSNIVSFFNDLTVSSEDKELRKANLKNDYLSWTDEATEIVCNLEAKERGYKSYDDLKTKVDAQGLSTLELDTLFTKFYPKLLETAKKFNRKDEKKK